MTDRPHMRVHYDYYYYYRALSFHPTKLRLGGLTQLANSHPREI